MALKCDTNVCKKYNERMPSGCLDRNKDVLACSIKLRPPRYVDADTINGTLSERGERYGDYAEQCRITRNIKRAMTDSPNWETLSDDKKEALEMIAVKTGRILNGDPEYRDSWHDIAGYAKLVEEALK